MQLTDVDLTRAHAQAWTETRALVIAKAPAFAHIFFSMMGKGRDGRMALFTKDIPTAATDGKNLMVNPEWFFAMPPLQRLFVVAHEILHNVLGHCHLMENFNKSGAVLTASGKSLPYSQELMNIAMDLLINDVLVEAGIGELPESGWHDRSLGTATDSCVAIYEKLYKNAKKKPKAGKRGDGAGGGFDQLLKPGTGDPDQEGESGKGSNKGTVRDDKAWQAAVAAAVESARLQGNMSLALERLLGTVIESKVTWKEHLQGLFSRMFGHERYDFSRPNRRFIVRDIFVPSTKSTRAGEIVVAIDTSGSCVNVFDAFISEVADIMESVRPEKVHVIWCDDHIQRVDEIEDLQELRELKGFSGGGTDFRPVFSEIAKRGIEPEAMVYLTDLYGDAPKTAPDYPVIWASITPSYKPFGYGEYVEIDVSAK